MTPDKIPFYRYNEKKLVDVSLSLTAASIERLRPQVKRPPNTLLQQEQQPKIAFLS